LYLTNAVVYAADTQTPRIVGSKGLGDKILQALIEHIDYRSSPSRHATTTTQHAAGLQVIANIGYYKDSSN